MEERLIIALENIIEHEFPKIKNLKISRGEDAKMLITFDEGEYTKKEVEDKLDEVKNYKPDLSFLENIKIEKTDFGFKIDKL